MRGGLIVGTTDRAKVEVCEEAGGEADNIIFGVREKELTGILQKAENGHYPVDGRLGKVFDATRQGRFSAGDQEFTQEICSILDMLHNTSAAGSGDGDE